MMKTLMGGIWWKRRSRLLCPGAHIRFGLKSATEPRQMCPVSLVDTNLPLTSFINVLSSLKSVIGSERVIFPFPDRLYHVFDKIFKNIFRPDQCGRRGIMLSIWPSIMKALPGRASRNRMKPCGPWFTRLPPPLRPPLRPPFLPPLALRGLRMPSSAGQWQNR